MIPLVHKAPPSGHSANCDGAMV